MPRTRAAARELSSSSPTVAGVIAGLKVGKIVGVDGALLVVEIPGYGLARARVATPLSAARVDGAVRAQAEAVLGFEDGDAGRPLVMGLIETGFADDREVVVEAREALVLRCGEGTIKLCATGKVVIRGTYVETRSTGTNRIKGGSVQIN